MPSYRKYACVSSTGPLWNVNRLTSAQPLEFHVSQNTLKVQTANTHPKLQWSTSQDQTAEANEPHTSCFSNAYFKKRSRSHESKEFKQGSPVQSA